MPVLVDGELLLYGYVGDAWWDGFTAREVLEALAELGRGADITVRINSGGGIADEGIAIYNALRAHRGQVAVEVDGIAASAASIIAMAGDTITMRRGALMMIHDPAGWADGTEADHRKAAEVLNKLGDLMAGIYADVSGDDATAVREEMRGELWLTGPEAVERGFATGTDEAEATEVAAFDYRAYAHAPERLVALADARRWVAGPLRRRAETTAQPTIQKQETMMTATTPAPAADNKDGPAPGAAVQPTASDERGRIKAILGSEDAKVLPTLAEHLAFETGMTAEAAVSLLAHAAADLGAATPVPETPAPEAYRQSRAQALADPAPAGGGNKTVVALDHHKIVASRRAAMEAK